LTEITAETKPAAVNLIGEFFANRINSACLRAECSLNSARSQEAYRTS
jgi:hypothetical protein